MCFCVDVIMLFCRLALLLSLPSFLVQCSICNAGLKENLETIQKFQITGQKVNEEYGALLVLIEAIKTLHISNYSDSELIKKTIKGLLSNMDPHTAYLDKKDFNLLLSDTSGTFYGIGTQIAIDNGIIRIVAVLDDTPAYKAKLKAGDYIVCIDDEYINGISSEEAVFKLRGKKNTKVKLKIKRANKDPFDVTLTRKEIKAESVKTEVLDGVLYARISRFDDKVSKKLQEAVSKNINSIKGMIIDFRDNHGGLLTEACDLSDLFLNKGIIVTTKGRDPADYSEFKAKSGDLLQGKPLVVLVNSATASAPEIVSGALKDNKRAIIVGTRTFGKGSVQRLIPLSTDTGVKITIAMYYTPSGTCIQGKGITPDIIVEPAYIQEDKNYIALREENLKNSLTQKGDEFVENESQKAIKEENIENEKDSEASKFIAFLKKLFKNDKPIEKNESEIKKKIREIEKKSDDSDFELLYRDISLKERKEKDMQLRTAFYVIDVKAMKGI